MTTLSLEEIVSSHLGDQYTLADTLYSDAQCTIFRAIADPAHPSLGNAAIFVDTAEDAATHFNRYLEASFLMHPNLIKVFHAGWLEMGNGRVPYVATECPDALLSQVIRQGRQSAAEIIPVAQQVGAGLSYLHGENLVYCALRESSVWRVGDQWKLADFSQLRVPGKEDPAISRRLLGQSNSGAPPEVYFGQVTPAWDTWSLGAMLSRILKPVPKRGANGERSEVNTPPLPPELEEIVADSLSSDPTARPDLADFLRVLASLAGSPATAAAPESVPQVVAGESPTPLAEPARRESVVEKAPAAAELAAAEFRSGPERPSLRDREELLPPSPRAFGQQPGFSPRFAAAHLPWYRTVSWPRLVLAALLAVGIFFLALYFGRSSHTPAVSGEVNPSSPSASPTGVPPPASAAARAPATDASPTSAAQPDADSPSGRSDGPLPTATKAEITSVLDKWVASTRARNAAEQASCYGPVIDTYYGRHNVTAAELRAEKERVFSQIGPVEQFRIGNVRYDQLGENWAVVSFNKTWLFGGRKPFSGTVREQMVLRSFAGVWRITSERDVKVLSSRMGRGARDAAAKEFR